MKILELRAENFARIKAVAIRPDGALVQITGKNSNGKSSVLAAIWTALKGRAVAPPTPIHRGAEEARIRLDLGELVVTRTFKRDKHDEITTDLKVVAADGALVRKRPQDVLDALVGDLSFDPLAFARMKPRDQFDAVKRLVAGFDFDDNAERRARAFDDRTQAKRVAKQHRAAADLVKLPAGPEPAAIDVSAKFAELEAAKRANDERESRVQRRSAAVEEAERKREEAENLRARAATLEREADAIDEKLAAADPLPAPIDNAPIWAEIKRAEDVKGARDLFRLRREHEQAAIKAEEDEALLDAAIATLDEIKRDAIASAKLPVEGLGIGDDVVLFAGVPLAEAGTADKIRVSTGIAMALNPDLRVALVDEGSELDAEHLGMLAKLAEGNDFQIWIAKVSDGGQTGIVIEDGMVADEAFLTHSAPAGKVLR